MIKSVLNIIAHRNTNSYEQAFIIEMKLQISPSTVSASHLKQWNMTFMSPTKLSHTLLFLIFAFLPINHFLFFSKVALQTQGPSTMIHIYNYNQSQTSGRLISSKPHRSAVSQSLLSFEPGGFGWPSRLLNTSPEPYLWFLFFLFSPSIIASSLGKQ